MSLKVSGNQTSLGEALPVRWSAEADLHEEVVAKAGDGSFWLRVAAGPMAVSESDGAFANGLVSDWPELRLHVSPTGAVMETTPIEAEDGTGSLDRALASLMTQLAPAILPHHPVVPGDEWTADCGGGRQTNRLLSLEGTGHAQMARIASNARMPLALDQSVAELGLATHLAGEARLVSELELEVETGLVRRHRGRVHIVTRSRVSLTLPEGPEVFLMESDLAIAFDIRLQSVDGLGVGGAGPDPSVRPSVRRTPPATD